MNRDKHGLLGPRGDCSRTREPILVENGAVFSFGENESGQLGRPATILTHFKAH